MQIGIELKSRLLVASVAVALLSGGCAMMDTSKDWIDIKDANELRALFTNKTLGGWGHIEGMNLLNAYWHGYYRADGHGVLNVDGKQYPLTWAVKGDDQVCFNSARGLTCYRYAHHRTHGDFYRAVNLANNQTIDFSLK